MDGAQVGVLKQTNQVGLAGLLKKIFVNDLKVGNVCSTDLKSANGSGLESEISFEILSDFSDETLEGQLPDEELSGLLVSPDLTESHSSGPVSVGLLDSSGGGGRLPGSLGGQLLPGSLSSGGLTGGLLGTSHGECSDDTDVRCRGDPGYIEPGQPPGGDNQSQSLPGATI